MADDNALGHDVATGLRKTLDAHGYGFHYSVLERAHELSRNGRSYWDFHASEFPVKTGTWDTRIDFILKRRHENIYLVAECKRANPARSTWCFAPAPYVTRMTRFRKVVAETCLLHSHLGLGSGGTRLDWSDDIYQLGFELRSGAAGDPGGAAKAQIEDAATQVAKGLHGFVNFFAQHLNLLEPGQPTYIIPAIFTTAGLWASDVALNSAALDTGILPLDGVQAVPKDWLWFQYHVSPSLRNAVRRTGDIQSLADALEVEYARTIAIVSPSGIDSFLTRDW